MTRDPIEPTSNEEAPRLAGDRAPPTWEADDDAGETWSLDDAAHATKEGDAGDRDKSDEDEGPGQDFAEYITPEPWRVSHLMIVVAVVAVFLWLCLYLKALMIVLTPIGLVVLAITAGFVTARLRASRQEALLALLAIAAERGMPLGAAISAFADQFRGRSQRRIFNVVAHLEAGEPLADALSGPTRVVSRDAILMVRVGDAVDALPAALRLVAGARPNRVGAWASFATRLTYLLTLLTVAEAITSFLLYFIVPKFEAIFKDFGVPLPGITIAMIRASHFVVRYAPISLAILAVQLILLVFLPFSYSGWMNYRVPIFDRLMARRHAALVLRALSVVIDAGRPIGLALEIMAADYPAPWFRRRLARAAEDVRRGDDWIEALWRRGAIRRADAEVLGSAASVGNLAWACRELADTTERRQQLRMQLVVQALFPLAIVTIGIAVAALCFGYFVPLVTLIQRLSDLP